VLMYRKHLDRLTSDAMCWIPYGDRHAIREFELIYLFFGHIRWDSSIVIYRPKKVVWQFGYAQTIPPYPNASTLCI